jgi:hypothetical protein
VAHQKPYVRRHSVTLRPISPVPDPLFSFLDSERFGSILEDWVIRIERVHASGSLALH